MPPNYNKTLKIGDQVACKAPHNSSAWEATIVGIRGNKAIVCFYRDGQMEQEKIVLSKLIKLEKRG